MFDDYSRIRLIKNVLCPQKWQQEIRFTHSHCSRDIESTPLPQFHLYLLFVNLSGSFFSLEKQLVQPFAATTCRSSLPSL